MQKFYKKNFVDHILTGKMVNCDHIMFYLFVCLKNYLILIKNKIKILSFFIINGLFFILFSLDLYN